MSTASSAPEQAGQAGHTTPPPPSGGIAASERDRAMQAYIAGNITVEELLQIFDRQGNWIERLMKHMAAHPASVERLSKLMKRAG